jgi:hypothetical protein
VGDNKWVSANKEFYFELKKLTDHVEVNMFAYNYIEKIKQK